MLTRTTYVGRHEFNRSSPKSGQKPAGEIVTAEVPPLIDQATFDTVQVHLRVRNPKVTPASVAPPSLPASASVPAAAAP